MKTLPSQEFRKSVLKEADDEIYTFPYANERTPLYPDHEVGRKRIDSTLSSFSRIFILSAAVAICLSSLLVWRNIIVSEHKTVIFQPHKVHVPRDVSGFPSFLDYHRGRSVPINVTFDQRAVKLNGSRVLFLSGSLHPVRATRDTWGQALDEAIFNGLNMITIYVMWGYHQPFQHRPLNWSLPGDNWDLADALCMAARRGLFVHLRPGPYACAEYSYGGIPEWIPLTSPQLRMRRLNKPWLEYMEEYLQATVDYLSDHSLFAHQGGPIVMVQIENELGDEDDDSAEENHLVVQNSIHPSDDQDFLLQVDSNGDIFTTNASQNRSGQDSGSLRTATVQDYADWCGSVAQKIAPRVLWTMCNGLSATNTISTFNGLNGVSWLENYGDSKRIQLDQPAMWTEDEGGFQLWGDIPTKPSDYFWGRRASDMAYNAMQWFARGGTHLNYYMFWGGYNRGRSAAAGIMNAYASDAVLCPSGERHHPKYGHFQALHAMLRRIAPVMLETDTALFKNQSIEMYENGHWVTSGEQRMFCYHGQSVSSNEITEEVIFVENDANSTRIVRVPVGSSNELRSFEMRKYSSILLVDGELTFDSSTIAPQYQEFRRIVTPLSLSFGSLRLSEPIGAPSDAPQTRVQSKAQEQTILNANSSISSDYAWFETEFRLLSNASNVKLIVETQKASAILAFVDGNFRSEANQHSHAEGPIQMSLNLGNISTGSHRLSLLSESLGYHNLIGRWGAPTTAKRKGILGDVVLSSSSLGNLSLVDGTRVWRSLPGLSLERMGQPLVTARDQIDTTASPSTGPTWTLIVFDKPDLDPEVENLFMEIKRGRGHVWLNGNDLGRYWNITRGDSQQYSQQYYHLPQDLLAEVNELLIFNVFADDLSGTRLVKSSLEKSEEVNMLDYVDYPGACL